MPYSHMYYILVQIMTAEDWNEIMYSGIQSYGGVNSLGVVVCVYFIIVVICGNCIVYSLYTRKV